MNQVTPFDVYKTYLSISRHFTTDTYDYHKYYGKSRCSLKSFYSNRSRYFFEKLSRKYSDDEILKLFVSNYAYSETYDKLWIGDIVKNGEERYKNWQKKVQSLSYLFKEESQSLFEEHKFEEVFKCTKGHPPLLKKFLTGKVSLETMVIYDQIFAFSKNFDKKLQDPVWETVSRRIKKYSPFLHIDVFRFRKILKEVVLGEK